MAGASVASPLAFTIFHHLSKPSCCFRLSQASFTPAHQAFHLSPRYLRNGRTRNPRTSIFHGKLSGSTGEDLDEVEEAFFDGDDEIEDESEEDESESSLDLLFRFFQSMFRKVSKRAKKATRSVLPPAISPQLVSFAVDGVLLLTSLSIVKALLEVICTLGGTVFIVILLLRVIWAAVSHFQASGNSFSQGGNSYGTAQPAM